MKSLSISQYQDGGGLSINQLKDILITVFAASLVVEGKMTLGMMLAIQYIIGQLSGPMNQMISFGRSAQDAKISLERLAEIHNTPNDEGLDDQRLNFIPEGDIVFENLSFKYTDLSNEVIKNISFTIPRGKTTAIVGSSGSGKTTLVKLILKFYSPTKGQIKIGDHELSNIGNKVWLSGCGAVMQDGFLFSDTISDNIAESDDHTKMDKVVTAATKANIMDFINELPLGFNTKVGPKGNGISQGQRQRLFIARALYKDPPFLCLDEATNSLDATNESTIMHDIQTFLNCKTAIIVAHRLSTVKNADNIIVMDHGTIAEQGTHKELIALKGKYFELIRNHLEIGG